MASFADYPHQNSSQRGLAMVLSLVSAIVLSPLYVNHRKSESRYEAWWGSGSFVLPIVVVAGLVVAIKTTSSKQRRGADFSSRDTNAGLFKIGSSSLGLAGILILLLFVISWQASVKQFFWR